MVEIGASSNLFFYSSYGEVAETEQAVAIKLGFIRSSGSTLSAKQLLSEKKMDPGSIDTGRISGNGLIVCLSKTDLIFSSYKTILGVPQLYYAIFDHGIICSDRLMCVVKLINRIELNEEMIPMYFLFRSTPGDFTYYRQIKRVNAGAILKVGRWAAIYCIVSGFKFYKWILIDRPP